VTDFNESLEKIKNCMLQAGDLRFGENCIKDASTELLRPTEDTVVEHWKIFQGATAYWLIASTTEFLLMIGSP